MKNPANAGDWVGGYVCTKYGTTLDQLKADIKSFSQKEHFDTFIFIVDNDVNQGNIALKPIDGRSGIRNYSATTAPYNASTIAATWTVFLNLSTDTIVYKKYFTSTNGTTISYGTIVPTISSYAIYERKKA